MIKTKKIFTAMIPILLTIAVSIFPAFYLYIQNNQNMFLYEALIVIALSAILAGGVYGVFSLIITAIKKKFSRFNSVSTSVCAGLLGAFFMAVFMNMNILRPLGSAVFDRPIDSRRVIVLNLAICLVLFCICTAAVFIFAKKQHEFLSFITKVIFAVICGMLVINCITIIPSFLRNRVTEDEKIEITGINTENIDLSYRPNVYYFILDEYAEFGSISQFYNYENAQFRKFLEENNFNISDSSHTLLVGPTYNHVANICSLQSVCTTEMTELECLEYIHEDAPLFSAWRALGYNQWQVSSVDYLPIASAQNRIKGLSSLFPSQTETGHTLLDLIVDNSMIFEFRELLSLFYARDFNVEKATAISDVFDYYDNREFLSTNSPSVFYSYVLCPHAPFFFEADGTLLAEVSDDWNNPEFYLNQYKYITTRMQNAAEQIILNDPDAIIIIQSDHGLRHTPGLSSYDTTRILNAVYCGGKTIDIEGLSAVDTFRLILTLCGIECAPIGYDN